MSHDGNALAHASKRLLKYEASICPDTPPEVRRSCRIPQLRHRVVAATITRISNRFVLYHFPLPTIQAPSLPTMREVTNP